MLNIKDWLAERGGFEASRPFIFFPISTPAGCTSTGIISMMFEPNAFEMLREDL
jgi:hypothetical protein